MTAIGIIPARYASQRFPGKPLTDIMGKPMIQRVYERAVKSKKLHRVYVATDDQRIFDVVRDFGGNAIMTSENLANGTERAAVVAKDLDCDLVVNIQGDEPLIEPSVIDQLVLLLENDDNAVTGTLVKKITDPKILANPNVPKVVIDKDFNALYFSRSMIPFGRDENDPRKLTELFSYYQHIGLYIYQKSFLLEFVKLPQSNLERIECLEQLRILENGYKIKVAVTETDSIGVDVPDDVKIVEKYLLEKLV